MPRFESWHGGVLPYPALLFAQLLIIAWFTRTARRFNKGDVTPHRRRGMWVMAFGVVYFLTMLGRLILGLTVMRESRWFTSYLPTFFHLVLASFLLLYAHFHLRGATTAD
ncbi:MAG TPA: hypothetical protein VF105_03805 [Gemmatimonadaceae bacterium]